MEENEPSYIAWMLENRPEMLKGSEDEPPPPPPRKEPPILGKRVDAITPNLDFWNEPPDPICLPYLKKMAEEKAKKDLEK